MSEITKLGTSVLDRIRGHIEGPNTYGNSLLFWGGFIIVVAVLAGFPYITNLYTVIQTSQYFALAFLGLSLCFIWGYAGILSFGQIVFFGIAAYTFGIIGLNFGSATGSIIALVGAIFVGTASAALLGYFMFYGGVRDTYVTIMTLVVALVLETFMTQTAGSEWAVGKAQLGGYNGMDVPSLTFGIGQNGIILERLPLYYTLLGALVVTYIGLRLLLNSRFGMMMIAIREDETRTETFGYNIRFIKLVVFTIGGALAALSGVLYASRANFVDPSVFGITFAALPVVWVTVGGRDSLIGAIGATLVIERMRTLLSSGIGPIGSEWALVIVGSLLLGVTLYLPDGVIPTFDRVIDQIKAKRADSDQSPPPTEEVIE